MGRREGGKREEEEEEEEEGNLLGKCPKEWAARSKLLFDSSKSFPKDR